MEIYKNTHSIIEIVNTEICRIVDIPDGHFKIQDGGQISRRYEFHMNPYIAKCMCANFDSPVENIFWTNGDHFKVNMAVRYQVGSDWYQASY